MGGNVSKTVVRKAVKPIKNINVEERAHKAVERHKVKPVRAPLHSTTKEKIEKQVADHPEIQDELEKHDHSLVDRVNTLHINSIEKMPKIELAERPLPQSREAILDPFIALEEPKKVPKGKVSLRQLGIILDRENKDPKLHQAECISKEFHLDVQETLNLLKYFEKIKMEEIVVSDKPEDQGISFKFDTDAGLIKPKTS